MIEVFRYERKFCASGLKNEKLRKCERTTSRLFQLEIQLFSNFWPFIPACHFQSTLFFYIPNLISPLWFVITFPVFVYSVKQLFHDLPSFSPLTLKSDRDLIATYSITAKSNIKVVRLEKMIADLRCS